MIPLASLLCHAQVHHTIHKFLVREMDKRTDFNVEPHQYEPIVEDDGVK